MRFSPRALSIIQGRAVWRLPTISWAVSLNHLGVLPWPDSSRSADLLPDLSTWQRISFVLARRLAQRPDKNAVFGYGIATAFTGLSRAMTDDGGELYQKLLSPLTSVNLAIIGPLGFRETCSISPAGPLSSGRPIPAARPSHRSRDLASSLRPEGPSPPSPRRAQPPAVNIAYSGLYHWYTVGLTTTPSLSGIHLMLGSLGQLGAFFAGFGSTFSPSSCISLGLVSRKR